MALALDPIGELAKRHATRDARQRRLDALAAKGLRRRATRSRIILGGAILAELRENPDDDAFLNRIAAILDDRVSRGRDRDDLRELLSLPVPERPSPIPTASADDPPDFESLTDAALRVPRSVIDADPAYADVRGLVDKA